MDIKTLLDNASNRRSLLKGMGVAAVGLTFTGALAGCGEKEAKKLANGEEGALNLYNWDDYMGETTLADFKGANGVDVKMDLFETNDTLFAKFRAGPGKIRSRISLDALAKSVSRQSWRRGDERAEQERKMPWLAAQSRSSSLPATRSNSASCPTSAAPASTLSPGFAFTDFTRPATGERSSLAIFIASTHTFCVGYASMTRAPIAK